MAGRGRRSWNGVEACVVERRRESPARPEEQYVFWGCALYPNCHKVTATSGTTAAAREATAPASATGLAPSVISASRPQNRAEELVAIGDERFDEDSGPEPMSSTMSGGATTLNGTSCDAAWMDSSSWPSC